eukprot:gene14869-19814_t
MRFQFWVDEFTHDCAPHYNQRVPGEDIQEWIDSFQVNMAMYAPHNAEQYPSAT